MLAPFWCLVLFVHTPPDPGGSYTLSMSTLISPEDLGRLRMAIARKMTVDLKPEAFNAQDIQDAYVGFWRTQEDVLKHYGHVPGDPYQFDLVVGEISDGS